MCQSHPLLLISHSVQEKILTSGFHWLTQKKWCGKLLSDRWSCTLRGDQRGGSQVNWKNTKKLNFSSTTFRPVFKICLCARCFDSSVCPYKIFSRHFADSSKLLKNHFVNELDLTSFKLSAIKWFFKSLEESAKCRQKILCAHTDELKCLAYRHRSILKTVVKVVEEKFNFFCVFLKLD